MHHPMLILIINYTSSLEASVGYWFAISTARSFINVDLTCQLIKYCEVLKERGKDIGELYRKESMLINYFSLIN